MAETYIDISPVISARTAVFPGDKAFFRHVAMDMDRGDHLTLSDIAMTVHIGAHVDAPSHYARHGSSIDERPIDFYIGPCQVIRISFDGRSGRAKSNDELRIRPDDLRGKKITAPRVLFATGTFPDPEQWRDDFASLSPELIDYLAARGVRLVGIDTPSIDPSDSKDLESHKAIAKHDMAILEGIVLTDVEPGLYTLIALPLRLQGVDASPVRAVLMRSALKRKIQLAGKGLGQLR